MSQKRGITLLQAADESGMVAALSLSRLEPPSRSNLPKDPPSKTATLHKKDDTDTRIIFKSCGTACSLLRFSKAHSELPSLFACAQKHKLGQQPHTDTYFFFFFSFFFFFYLSADHVAQQGSAAPRRCAINTFNTKTEHLNFKTQLLWGAAELSQSMTCYSHSSL